MPTSESLWRHPAFLRLWTASAVSDIGSQVSALALPLIAALMLDATAWEMGLLSAAESAPTLLVGLFAGVWVDRRRRRSVMIGADLGRAALLLIVPLASALGMLRLELLYAVALLAGALSVLFDVSHLSYLPSLVDRRRLVEGNSAEFGQWMSLIVYYVSAVSIRQALTPDRLRGRVNATIRFAAGGMQPIGALIGGALGSMLGLPATLVVAAFGMLLAVVWLYLSPVRTLRALPAIES